jgi:hypothetical protein|tara:strand:+ start:403 stop:642 length:240 start_codon:yes stop_codon:yes gene_type:complete
VYIERSKGENNMDKDDYKYKYFKDIVKYWSEESAKIEAKAREFYTTGVPNANVVMEIGKAQGMQKVIRDVEDLIWELER